MNKEVLNGWRMFARAYIRLTAGIIFIAGLALLLTALDDEPLLRQQDALTGLSTRVILLIAGFTCVGLGIYLFTARALFTKGLLISWLCLNLIVYRIGMDWMNESHPTPAVILTGWKVGIWPRILGRYVVALTVYLALGSLLIIVLERKTAKANLRNASSQFQSPQKHAV